MGTHANKTLTEQQRKFVDNYVRLGMQQTQAARAAGFAFPTVEASRMFRTPQVVAAIKDLQTKMEKQAGMSRQKVIDGLAEAIEMARVMGDPNAMVGGWREVARICGYYAPETKKLEVSVNGAVAVSQIAEMTDAELVNLIIEGDSLRLPDEDPETLALPAPEETDGLAAE